MKKMILVCLSILMTTGLVQQVSAQNISGGFKVEANMSNFLLSDMPGESSTMKLGPTVGGFMKIDLHENFAVQPEMLFFFRNSKSEKGLFEDDIQQWGMQIPVYAVGQMKMGNGKGYVGVGPYVGLGFDARYKDLDVDLYEKDALTDKAAMDRWDFGLGLMLGYEFNNGLQINAGYQLGLIDQLDALKDNATKRTQTVSLGIGYRF